MMEKTGSKRNPIKKAPLRDPGQSLREQIDTIFTEVGLFWGLMVTGFAMIAAVDLCRWWMNLPPTPALSTVIAIAVACAAAWRLKRTLRRIRQLETGLHGERSMGQFLQEELLPRGYRVFHDICDDVGNIDHVVIGPAGVFSVETKTISKPERGDARVRFDGERVTVDGHDPDRNPIPQARACADSLARILAEYGGQKVFVRPVVVYPGWYVDEARESETWVLNPDRFIGYVRREDERLTRDQVAVLASSLERYVRDREKR